MKIIFWLLACLDAAAILLFFVLGLAAAVSSRTSFWSVAAVMLVVPMLILGAAILLFVRSSSPLWRGVALALAAAPLAITLLARQISDADLRRNSDSQGNLTHFREGPMRDIATAIANNDAAAVGRLAPQADLNSRGYAGRTLLLTAFRQLEKTPDRLDVVRTLIKAGADPNAGADEWPLQLAVRLSGRAGTEPALLLLAAGAKPNAPVVFGDPVFFTALGRSAAPDMLRILLDHGADVNAKGHQDTTALFAAANTLNWKAALLLLQRGADANLGKSVNGLPFKSLIESYRERHGAESGFAEVAEHLRREGR